MRIRPFVDACGLTCVRAGMIASAVLAAVKMSRSLWGYVCADVELRWWREQVRCVLHCLGLWCQPDPSLGARRLWAKVNRSITPSARFTRHEQYAHDTPQRKSKHKE